MKFSARQGTAQMAFWRSQAGTRGNGYRGGRVLPAWRAGRCRICAPARGFQPRGSVWRSAAAAAEGPGRPGGVARRAAAPTAPTGGAPARDRARDRAGPGRAGNRADREPPARPAEPAEPAAPAAPVAPPPTAAPQVSACRQALTEEIAIAPSIPAVSWAGRLRRRRPGPAGGDRAAGQASAWR